MAQEKNDKVKEAAQAAAETQQPEEELEACAAGTEAEEPAAEASEEDALAQAREEAADWQARFMRLHAEWDTYRRRTDEQRADERLRAGENLVSSLLPVLDDFERSIDYAVKNGETGLLNGVRQVYSKMIGVLEKGGVVVIDPAGEPFDALEHQAVANVDRTDVFDETVEQVYQKGYKMGKKVIRPAMVTVTTGGPKRPAEDAGDAEAE